MRTLSKPIMKEVSQEFRVLCEMHPYVDYKTAWGCPECVREMREMLKGALHALRSYQYGNTSPDLAESLANKIEQMVLPDSASIVEGAVKGAVEGAK